MTRPDSAQGVEIDTAPLPGRPGTGDAQPRTVTSNAAAINQARCLGTCLCMVSLRRTLSPSNLDRRSRFLPLSSLPMLPQLAHSDNSFRNTQRVVLWRGDCAGRPTRKLRPVGRRLFRRKEKHEH
jgi:hypothetical protein